MRYAKGSTLAIMLLAITAALVCGVSVFPILANAQGSPGQNAVYNSSNGIVGSSSFIDASVFGAQNTDICAVLKGILTSPNYPPSGAVIDARGIPGATHTSMICSGSPWAGITNPPPSTILLPATTAAAPIVISSKWILPSHTHLIGQGDAITPNGSTLGTTIRLRGHFRYPAQ
jgi:hypothetical protein